MPITMMEPIARAILAELEAHLPAKILALQLTFNPVLTMDAPVEYAFGDSDFVKGFPVVTVDAVRLRIREDDLRWQDHEKQLEVGLFVANVTRGDLLALLDRYGRCVVETLHDRRAAGSFIDSAGAFDLGFRDEDIEYGPTSEQANQFVRALFVPMHATRRDVEKN